MLRSEKIQKFNIFLSRDNAIYCMLNLFELNAVQFVDQNISINPQNRPYANEMKKVENTLNQLDFLFNELYENHITYRNCQELTTFLTEVKEIQKYKQTTHNQMILEYQEDISSKVEHYKDQKAQLQSMKNKINQYVGQKAIICQFQFLRNQKKRLYEKLQFDNICGMINAEDTQRFKRILFRASKNNIIMFVEDIDKQFEKDMYESNESTSQKAVFMLIFPAGENNMLRNKIDKIVQSFSVEQYEISQDRQLQQQQLIALDKQIRELKELLTLTLNEQQNVLKSFADMSSPGSQHSLISFYSRLFQREQAILRNLEKFRFDQQLVKGVCWIQKQNIEKVMQGIRNEDEHFINGQLHKIKISKERKVKTPTFIFTNKFTGVFQQIVDTYGTPQYQEINPGVFTIIFFPFLFGVMFGDIAHGSLLFLFGLFLLQDQKQKQKSVSKKTSKQQIVTTEEVIADIHEIFYPYRYLLSLMGFFAVYAGFIYNDFASIGINLFMSCYDEQGVRAENCVYIFGLDPIWHECENELAFSNSYKMKMAVIIGFFQMMLGIMLKGANLIFQKKYADFVCKFIPQVIFMTSIFGYMILLIFLKWNQIWVSDPPSIIKIMIDMVMKMGIVKHTTIIGKASFATYIQQNLLTFALIAIIVMFMLKPFLGFFKSNKYSKMTLEYENGDINDEIEDNHHEDETVHDFIEAIEFLLGTLSNTASYLRLWALSLAHSQLAKVFFDNTVKVSIESGNPISIIICYFILFNVSFGVLICMDMMECFLHAIRLQWVEFQSKFFVAEGNPFQPFGYKALNIE